MLSITTISSQLGSFIYFINNPVSKKQNKAISDDSLLPFSPRKSIVTAKNVQILQENKLESRDA